MQNVKSDFLRVMMERGFFHQCSDLEGLDEKLTTETVSAYLGFDLTAKSFHVLRSIRRSSIADVLMC